MEGAGSLDEDRVKSEIRALVRSNGTWSLGTLNRDGTPLTTLVLGILDQDQAPYILISSLARHTQNLHRDARASILVTEADITGDPMATRRVSLTGNMLETDKTQHLEVFASQHPYAQEYVNFKDFSIHRMEIQQVEFVSGFGGVKIFHSID